MAHSTDAARACQLTAEIEPIPIRRANACEVRQMPGASSGYPPRCAPSNACSRLRLRDAVDNSSVTCRNSSADSIAARIFPCVVERETERRNRKRLLTRSPAPAKAFGRAKQPIAGTAGVGGQRRGHPELIDVGKTSNEASRVRVAASDAPSRGERVPRFTVRRTQSRVDPLVTAVKARAILGTGPGNVARIERFVRQAKPHGRPVGKPPCHPVG